MTKLIIWRKCLLCRRSCFDGLVVRGRLLCPACESGLVRLGADDPDYDAVRLVLRRLWSGGVSRPNPAAVRRVAVLPRAW